MARPTWSRSILLGAFAGLAVLTAGCLAQGLGWSTSWLKVHQLWAGSLASLLLLAARSPLERVAAHIAPSAGPPALWRGIILGAAALAFALAVHLDHRFQSGWSVFRMYNSFWELEPETFLAPAMTTIASAVWCRCGDGSPPGRPRRMRRWAWLLTAAAAIATVGGGIRAARAPLARDYLASLPTVGVASELTAPPAIGPDGLDNTGENSTFFVDKQLRADLVLRRYAFEPGWHCVPRLARSAADLAPQSTRSYGVPLSSCGAVALRHDARHGVYVLDTATSSVYSPGPMLFDATTLAHVGEQSVANARFADGMALPWSWLWAAALTTAIALLVLLTPGEAARRLAARREWRPGVVGEDGVIRFNDGTTGLAPDVTLPAGPVVSFDPAAAADQGGPFRGGAPAVIPASSLVRGDPEPIATGLRASLEARDAFAAAAAAFGAAPLLAAATVRLLF
jgi:hypothetical protein